MWNAIQWWNEPAFEECLALESKAALHAYNSGSNVEKTA